MGITARGRARLKHLAYASGLLGALHRLRDALTVATFHRVLPPDDERSAFADPLYTISLDQLEQCLEFFDRHYSLVDLAAVRAAARGEATLPTPALLVTFDDGWADTEEYALPVLLRRGYPAVVFVVSSGVDSRHPFWQERVFRAWKSGADPELLATAWRGAGIDAVPPPVTWQENESVRLLINRLRPLAPDVRLGLVEHVENASQPTRPELLTHEQLWSLHRAGIAIGAHGATHEALAERQPGIDELSASKSHLSALLDGAPIETMSFPHGSYDDDLLRAAATTYELVFTSDGCVNAVRGGHVGNVLGRIEIRAGPIVDANGDVRPELLARWLFARPRVAITAPAST